MNETRKDLEKINSISSKLNGYTFISNDILMTKLKIGYLIRYIKKSDGNKKAHIAIGGKLENITEDTEKPGYVYRIKIKTNGGSTFLVKLKDNNKIFMYYKIMSDKNQRLRDAEELKKKLTSYERKKLQDMHNARENLETDKEKRAATKKYYIWLYERRPELKPNKN